MSGVGGDVVHVDPLWTSPGCAGLASCAWHQEQLRTTLVGRYVGLGDVGPDQVPMARLQASGWSAEEYWAAVRERHGGEVAYEVRKARRRGYAARPFSHATYLPDVVEIDHSKHVRSGGAMRGAYLTTLAERGGAPETAVPHETPPCPVHYDDWWGLFAPEPGRRQGAVQVDDRLLAYVRLRRNGTYALYAQVLGHGDHLKEGVVYALHAALVDRLLSDHPAAVGVDHLLYGAWVSGGEGLQRWKRRLLFSPALLVLREAA